MSEVVKLRTQAEIDEEAAKWIWCMDSGTVTHADQEAFDRWMHQDARHRCAFEELSKVWTGLNGLAEAKREEKIATFSKAAASSERRAPRLWLMGAAAMLLLTVGAVVWLQMGSERQTLSTAVGQQRDVTLVDGSVVTLNTNTILDTDLTRRSRQIYLRKGEAHFSVAHDRSRPFLVHAGDAVVRAVGTEFDVRLLSDQHVDILVNEGRVEVQPTAATSDSQPAEPKRRGSPLLRAVRAGEQLSTATADYAVSAVSPEQLSSDMAWREGAIIFDGKPLAEAVVEIERYTDARIVVSDPGIAALRVGGRFRTDNVEGFFDALQTAFPIAIRRTSDGMVYLDPRR